MIIIQQFKNGVPTEHFDIIHESELIKYNKNCADGFFWIKIKNY